MQQQHPSFSTIICCHVVCLGAAMGLPEHLSSLLGTGCDIQRSAAVRPSTILPMVFFLTLGGGTSAERSWHEKCFLEARISHEKCSESSPRFDFEPLCCGFQKTLQNTRQIFLQGIKKIHRRASAGAQGEENRNVLIFNDFFLVSPTEKERKHTFVRVQMEYGFCFQVRFWIGPEYGFDWF